MADVRIDHKDLERLYAGIFAAKGMSAADAGAVADVLAWANVRGVDGHGGVRIPGYLDYIDSGECDPRARPQVKTLGPTAFTVDAARSAGPVAMMKAAKLAVANPYPNPRPITEDGITRLLDRALDGLPPIAA